MSVDLLSARNICLRIGLWYQRLARPFKFCRKRAPNRQSNSFWEVLHNNRLKSNLICKRGLIETIMSNLMRPWGRSKQLPQALRNHQVGFSQSGIKKFVCSITALLNQSCWAKSLPMKSIISKGGKRTFLMQWLRCLKCRTSLQTRAPPTNTCRTQPSGATLQTWTQRLNSNPTPSK